MPATATDRLFGLTTSVAVKAPVQISANYNVIKFGVQTITSSTQASGLQTVTTTTGMRVLLMGQSDPRDNGIWEARVAAWVRAPDFDGARDVVNGTMVLSVYGDIWQVVASNPVHIGSTAISFREALELQVARWRDEGDVRGWGGVGDGVTNDTAAFQGLEYDISGRYINLRAKTYLVDYLPVNNKYYGGKFLISGVTHDAIHLLAMNVNNVISMVGNSGSSIPPNYSLPEINQFTFRNGSFVAGGALNKATASGQTVAIGPDAMSNTLISFDNIAIGEVSLQNVQSNSDAYSSDATGTRNVAVGGNTLQFLTTGWNNVAVGRNAGVCAVNTIGMVAIGNGAFGGIGENGWYGYVENFCPNNSGQTYSVAIGQSAGAVYQGTQLTTIGGDSGKAMRKGVGNSLFGRQSGSKLESLVGLNGKQLTTLNVASTYVKTGSNMVITVSGHNTVVGGYIAILPTSGPADVSHNHVFPCLVTAVSGNDVTVQCPYIGDGSGEVTVGWTVNTTDGAFSQTNAAFGDHTIMNATSANNVVAVGNRAGQNTVTATDSTLIGSRAGQNSSTLLRSTFCGIDSANNATIYTDCSGIGRESLRRLNDGSIATSLTNSTGIGNSSQVSGDNQVQIGNSATTTYVYGTVQNRSDKRDKIIDDHSPVLGLDFILGLNPVQGVWNMREDYLTLTENDDGTQTATFDQAAYDSQSKKRTRLHQWFIAQEVVSLLESLDVNPGSTGLLQHHLVNGGSDVYSLGYDEFIPPVVRAIQECWKKINEHEERLANIENKVSLSNG